MYIIFSCWSSGYIVTLHVLFGSFLDIVISGNFFDQQKMPFFGVDIYVPLPEKPVFGPFSLK